MTNPLLSNAKNACRQRNYRNRQIDAGRVGVKVWLDFEVMENLRALAYKRRLTLNQTIEMAIDETWEAAGRP